MGLFKDLVSHFVVDPLIQKANDKKDARISAEINEQQQAKYEEREQERDAQLRALRDLVPSAPPERMRATIQLNQFRQGRTGRKKVSHLLGDDSFVYVETGEDTKYSVDMILELPESERALIKQYELDDIVLEDIAAHSDDYLLRHRVESDEEAEARSDPLRKEISKQINTNVQSLLKAERRITRIGDLVVSPYSRVFDSPHEANDYAAKLKTKFLPELRKLLDRHREHKPTETLEF
jgi:hypothetical protein